MSLAPTESATAVGMLFVAALPSMVIVASGSAVAAVTSTEVTSLLTVAAYCVVPASNAGSSAVPETASELRVASVAGGPSRVTVSV